MRHPGSAWSPAHTAGPTPPNDGQLPEGSTIIDANQDALARRQRFAVAADAASRAVRKILAQHYPEATPHHGTPLPDEATAREFDEAMRTAARAWLAHARPNDGFASTLSAGQQLAQERTEAVAQRLAAHVASCGLTTDQLADITARAVHDEIDDLLAGGDFAPIGDDAARYALRNEADYRLSEAGDAGLIGLARLLYEVLGEPAATAAINASIEENTKPAIGEHHYPHTAR